MQLEHAIIALWVISSMLACWFFSLFVRSIAEYRARRTHRLASLYTKRAKWIAALLMLICLSGSALAGGYAQWMSTRPGIGGVRLTPLGSIGIGMLFFAGFLAVWAIIGDRSRGRLRCPRCWYDMSDSGGHPCPECGREIEGEKQLIRTRRPRWAFVVALLFVVLGASGMLLNNRFKNNGAAGFVPNGMLLTMWENMPESWVFDTGVGAEQHNLTRRIKDGTISDAQRRELTIKLIDEMLADPLKRWEVRRMNLLDAIQYREIFSDNSPDGQPDQVWIPEDDRLARLYSACINDLALYVQHEEKLIDLELEVRITDAISGYSDNTWKSTRRWLLAHAFGVPEHYYSFMSGITPEIISHLEGLIGEARKGIERANDTGGYWSEDTERLFFSMNIELESGVLRDRVPELLAYFEIETNRNNRYFTIAVSNGLTTTPESERGDALEQLERWIVCEDIELRIAALQIISAVYNDSYGEITSTSPIESRFIQLIRDHAIDDARKRSSDPRVHSVSDHAWDAVVSIDASGMYSYKMLRDDLLDPDSDHTRTLRYDLTTYRSSDERLKNWAEAFEPLVRHPDPKVRSWILSQTPDSVISSVDDRIDAMLEVLLNDPVFEIRDDALTVLENRRTYRARQAP